MNKLASKPSLKMFFNHLNIKSRRLTMTTKGIILGTLILIPTSLAINTFLMRLTISENTAFFQAAAEMARLSGAALVVKNDISSACDILEEAQKKGLFSFYTIQFDTPSEASPVSKTLCFGPLRLKSEILVNYVNMGVPIEAGGFTFQTDRAGKYLVTTGAANDSWATFLFFIRPKLPRMGLGFLFAIVLFGILSKILSRPLVKILAGYKKIDPSEPHFEGSSKHNSRPNFFAQALEYKESQQVHAASRALKKEEERLRSEAEFIAPDFSTSLIKKMKKNKNDFPHFFEGAILRFDLNGFTKLYFENDKIQISAIVRAIAVDIDELVNRYSGTHYGFGGDEFLELFEGKDCNLRALACARDIFAVTERMQLSEDVRSRVKFKASMARDKDILFSRLPQCYTLTSDALILTNRYFTVLEEKDSHSLLLGEADAKSVECLAEFIDFGEHYFKNMVNSLRLKKVKTFKALEDLAQQDSFLSLIQHFRSDADIVLFFGILSNAETSKTLRQEILVHLKLIKVSVCHNSVIDKWLELICFMDKNWDDLGIFLSSALKCGMNLIPSAQWNSSISEALLSLNSLKNQRIQADVIEILQEKCKESDFNNYIERFFSSENLLSRRSRGNLLIARAENSLNENTLLQLGEMLDASDPGEIATGIYCTSQIIHYYRANNPLLLSQYLQVEELVEKIISLSDNENELIRKRSQIELDFLSGRTTND